MKLEKILVATDFSEQAAVALHQALRIVRRKGAELILLHVSELPLPDPEQVLRPELATLHRTSEEHLASVRDQLDALWRNALRQGANVTKLIAQGWVDEAIVAAAAETAADLVVVGTHGRARLERLLLGSVAERVVRLAETNVMVARREPEPRRGDAFRRILVPTDFSEPAEQALDLAVWLAAPDAHVEIFHVLRLPYVIGFGFPELAGAATMEIERWRTGAREEAQERGRKLAATAARPDVRLEVALAEGAPAPEIHRRLEEERYDLVVMGTHGRRGVRRSLLGSVAEATVRHAPCSVLTLRAPALQGR
jgi:nucleotide-binding universal stress UspA family protein